MDMEVPKKVKTELPYDPVIPVLGIYPKETTTVTQNHVCTPMFIAVLLTVTKIWKQTKCPLSDEWIRKCGVYTHTHTHTHIQRMEYYSVIKKNEILPFFTCKDLEGIILTERSQRRQIQWGKKSGGRMRRGRELSELCSDHEQFPLYFLLLWLFWGTPPRKQF